MSPVNVSGIAVDIVDLHLRLGAPHWSSEDVVLILTEFCDRAEDSTIPRPFVLELDGPEPGAEAVASWTEAANVTLVNKWERAVRRLEQLAVPTITLASGECSGQSLDLLLATDYRIGTPEVRLGLAHFGGMLWPGMALHRLAQQVGMAAARRMALFGRTLNAEEALELGLLDEVTEDPDAAIGAVVRQVGELAGKELAVRRRLLLEAAIHSHEQAIGVHLSAVDRTLRRGRGYEGEDPR